MRVFFGMLVCATLTVTAFAAGPSPASAIPMASAAEESRLHVTVDDLSRLSGWFESQDSISFSARAELRDRAVATITATGIQLQITMDLGRGVATIDGQGQISAASRPSLQQFARDLTAHFGTTSRRGLHANLLNAAATLVAEAPAGWQPNHTVVLAPGTGSGQDDASPTGTEECQVADQDGIDYLEGGCAFQPYDDICHDSQNLCFTCETVLNGCEQAADCPGNCFTGCTSDGRGWYTRDCAEYDRCCELNTNCNGVGVCFDEFRDSLNDILFGWRELNCVEGCAP